MDGFPIAEALRLLRTRKGLSQTRAAQLPGAPDHRTLSHWETRRKHPSLLKLYEYLGALEVDFRGLQEVLDQIEGRSSPQVEKLAQRLDKLEQVVGDLVKDLGETPS